MEPVVITVFDAEAGTTAEYTFVASPVRIGRNPLNDLALPFAFVSGWHAIVRFDETGTRFFDLGSTNGTLLDGRRIQAGEPVEVYGEVSVTIGKLELRIRRAGAAAWAPAPVAAPASGGWTAATPAGASPPRAPTGFGIASGTIDPAKVPGRGGTAMPDGTAHVQMSDVHQTIARLRPLYDGWRQSWSALHATLQSALTGMDRGVADLTLTVMQRELPAIATEPDVADLAARIGSSVSARPVQASAADGGQIAKLAEAVRPGEEPPRSPEEAARFLRCVEDVLRASAKAFIELQKGQEQFGNEMGVRTIKEFTALHAAGTPENLLRYLLDWQKGGPHRTQELVGVYADLMIHQVALLNGVVEGARALLRRLDPDEIERGVEGGWNRTAAAWRAYAQRWRELAADDKRVTETVFGAEFARAYAEVGGER
jgi:type VI secretion system FHA domain protein